MERYPLYAKLMLRDVQAIIWHSQMRQKMQSLRNTMKDPMNREYSLEKKNFLKTMAQNSENCTKHLKLWLKKLKTMAKN
ncbi:MAG: hypothetical protein GY928_32095 [Colwellia sp.]|nr:hypothetical protein [Colwellia sp.]